MSDDGVASILRRLDAMEAAHAEEIQALGARIDVLTKAHQQCAAHCWVGNQAQVRAALRAIRDTSESPAIPEGDPTP